MRIVSWVVALAAAASASQDPAPKVPETIVHRMGDLRWQHGANITSIAVLPGDKQALSAGYNGSVLLWDLETGTAIRTFDGHKGLIHSMALFPDGKRFVTGGADGKVLVWELESAAPIRTLGGPTTPVRAVAVTRDGGRVLAGSQDGWITAWDPAVEKPLRSMQSPEGFVSSLSLQPGGKLAAVDGAGKVLLFDLETGKQAGVLALSGDVDPNLKMLRGMEKLAFSPDGRSVAAYFRTRGVTVWDAATGKETKVLGNKQRHYDDILFATDGRVFLGGWKEVEIWDFEKGEILKTITGGSAFRALALKGNGKEILSTFLDGSITVWDLETGKRKTEAGGGEVFTVAYAPDGRSVFAGVRGGSLSQWDVTSGRKIRDFDKLAPRSEDSPLQEWAATIALSADGRQALTGHWDCRGALWDVATGKVVREYDHKYGMSIQGVAISPDGRMGLGSGVPAILFDLETGVALHSFGQESGAYASVAFSPDSKSLLLGSNAYKLRLFDVAKGTLIREFEGNPGRVDSIAFTADGRRVVTGSESGEPFVLWEVATGREIRKFAIAMGPHPTWGSALALSPDNLHLYTRSAASELLVWDLESGKVVKSYEGHLNFVKAIALSPGGRFVTTGSQDTMVIHRHPGLPLKEKAAAWAAGMVKLDDDGKDYAVAWKRFMTAMRTPDYDVWTETLERAVAFGESLVDDLVKEFPQPGFRMAKEVSALMADLDKDDIEAREKAMKGLTALGEPAYAYARARMKDASLSEAVRAALKSFCRDVEGKVVGPFETKDLAELRAVLILLELPDSTARRSGLEHFAEGPLNSVPARLARRYVDQVLRR